MNDPLNPIDKLANLARRESMPSGDVTQRVLQSIRTRTDSIERPLTLFAAAYAGIAVIAIGWGVSLYLAMNDPVAAMYEFASVISP